MDWDRVLETLLSLSRRLFVLCAGLILAMLSMTGCYTAYVLLKAFVTYIHRAVVGY